MVAVNSRNTMWYFGLLLVLGAVGWCAIGYWMTYDLACFGDKVWVWTKFPPGFECQARF